MTNLLLNAINWATVGIVLAIVAVIAVVFAVLIIVVSKICFVKEDEKAVAITENLAGANCGGCGYAGCADFAKALAEGKAQICGCGPTSTEGKAKIAEILGTPFVETEPTFAVVKCAGGNKCKDKFDYIGNKDCASQIRLMNGKKCCPEGCLGDGSCASACPDGAVKVVDGVATIEKELCESCGLCVKACPKNLIEFIPRSAKVFVACSTKCRGKETMANCQVGCIGCGLCAKNCPNGAITMQDNLAVIDYAKCTGCGICADKCPKKCIHKL